MFRENKTIKERATKIKQIVTTSNKATKIANKAIEKHTNKKRKDMHFEERDLVKFVAKHIRTL